MSADRLSCKDGCILKHECGMQVWKNTNPDCIETIKQETGADKVEFSNPAVVTLKKSGQVVGSIRGGYIRLIPQPVPQS